MDGCLGYFFPYLGCIVVDSLKFSLLIYFGAPFGDLACNCVLLVNTWSTASKKVFVSCVWKKHHHYHSRLFSLKLNAKSLLRVQIISTEFWKSLQGHEFLQIYKEIGDLFSNMSAGKSKSLRGLALNYYFRYNGGELLCEVQ